MIPGKKSVSLITLIHFRVEYSTGLDGVVVVLVVCGW